MLAASPTTARYGEPAEEWAIHDYEGFGLVALSEWERVERVADLARGVVRHSEAFVVRLPRQKRAWGRSRGSSSGQSPGPRTATRPTWQRDRSYASR